MQEKPTKNKGGRPRKARRMGAPLTMYKPEIVDEICQRMCDGETLASICRDPRMPCRNSIGDWCKKHPEFKERLDQAYEGLADSYFDQMINTAKMADNTNIGPANLIVKTLQYATNRFSRRYAEKRQIEQNTTTNVNVNVNKRVDLSLLDDDALDQLEGLLNVAQAKVIDVKP